MNERRRARRRRMPFVRSGVLVVEGRSHIVALLDLSPEGAFLSTRIDLPAGQEVELRLVLPRAGGESCLPCTVVRRSDRFDPAHGQPAGLAVRFHGLDAGVVRRVEDLAAEGFLPAPEPAPAEHFEYRVLEREALDEAELNRLGLDGWGLSAAVRDAQVYRLVLRRRL
ncbi:MAG: PilZ domain-containing protein [Vicinamibacteria bacterium]